MHQITSANPETLTEYRNGLAVYTAHYRGNGWWQIFRPAYKSTPDFEAEKLPQIFHLIRGNIW